MKNLKNLVLAGFLFIGTNAVAAVPMKAQLDQAPLDAKFGFSYGHQLARYAELKRKVFLSADEQSEKARLLVDQGLTNSTEQLLHWPSFLGSPLQALQNDAVDFLVEAVTNPKNPWAAQVMRSIVQNKEIENDHIDLDLKRSLAGFKAELMYQWTAVQPEVASQIPGLLPGAVSQKLWKNVVAAQAQNASESTHREESLQPLHTSQK